jgi:PD-(D/E)XK nuclease superfamily
VSRADDATVEAWRHLTETGARDPHELHVSHLWDCLRQVHYRATKEPVTDRFEPEPMVHAHMGTAIDALFVPAMAVTWPRRDDRIERCQHHADLTGTIDGVTIHAQADIVAWLSDGTAWVWDAKTLAATGYDAVSAGQPRPQHWWQVWCYARLTELIHNTTVTRTHLYYVCRSDPHAYKDPKRTRRWDTLIAPYTQDHRDTADQLIGEAVQAATSTTTTVPRWFGDDRWKISGLHSPCRSCPWQQTCLGKAASGDGPADAAAITADMARALYETKQATREAGKALQGYLALYGADSDAADAKKTVTELVEDYGLDDGIYTTPDGAQYQVKWNPGGDITDQKTLTQRAKDAGWDIPTKPRKGHFSVKQIGKASLDVTEASNEAIYTYTERNAMSAKTRTRPYSITHDGTVYRFEGRAEHHPDNGWRVQVYEVHQYHTDDGEVTYWRTHYQPITGWHKITKHVTANNFRSILLQAFRDQGWPPVMSVGLLRPPVEDYYYTALTPPVPKVNAGNTNDNALMSRVGARSRHRRLTMHQITRARQELDPQHHDNPNLLAPLVDQMSRPTYW